MGSLSALLLLLAFQLSVVRSAPEVHTTVGTILGTDLLSPTGKRYYGFRGIPYAQAPIGKLRFVKPQPYPLFTTPFNASNWGNVCWQSSILGNVSFPMNEDCLNLNVFVPDGTSFTNSSKQVIIYIHGGGFQEGMAASFDPWKMVTENDVIVVVIQYRLGAFGFISSGESSLPGNYGLWDQRLAITWVKNNIAGFGGNPDSITIMGESAGGASVSWHMFTTKSKGLFKRVIMQSGTTTAPWGFQRNPLQMTLELARRLQCLAREETPVDKTLMIACLRKLSAIDLHAKSSAADFLWPPTVDNDFITKEPLEALADEAYLEAVGFYDYDVLMGVNNNEGALYFFLISPDQMSQTSVYDQMVVSPSMQQRFGTYSKDMEDIVKFHYTYPRLMDNGTRVSLQGALDTAADFNFVVPAVEWSRAHAQKPGRGKLYFYLFDHYPTNSGYGGMVHGADIYFLFNNNLEMFELFGYKGNFSDEDYQLMDKFAAFTTQFAKTSDPNPALLGSLGTEWPEYTSDQEDYLAFTTNITIRQHLYPKRVSLILDLLPTIRSRWLMKLSTPPSYSTTTAPPCVSSTPTKLTRFNLDTETAEYVLIGLIAGVGVLLIITVIVVCCACSKKSSKVEKYTVY